MRFAQLYEKHTACLRVMQLAYAQNMEKIESPRRVRRRLRLEMLLAEAGGAADVARAVDTPKSYISALVNATRGVGDKFADKLEKAYNKPKGWFDIPLPDEPIVTNPTSEFLSALVPIKRVRFILEPGAPGFSVEADHDDDGPLAFSSSWLFKRALDPSALYVIRTGDSNMGTTLHADDSLVINTGDTKLVDGVVYAFNYEGAVLVRRLVRNEERWWLSSDNPDKSKFPPKTLTGNVHPIGKVIHMQSDVI